MIVIGKIEFVILAFTFTPSTFYRIRRIAIKKCFWKVYFVYAISIVKIVQLLDRIIPTGNGFTALNINFLFRHVPAFILTLTAQTEKRLSHPYIKSAGLFNIIIGIFPAVVVFLQRAWCKQ